MNINPINESSPKRDPIPFRFNHSLNAWEMFGFFRGDSTNQHRWIAVQPSTVKEFMDAKRANIIVEGTISA